MNILFHKMHGCGNDFIVIDGRKHQERSWKDIAPKLLDRRFGVGGDSMLVILPSSNADAKMAVFERTGRESETCGNGIRCVARLLREEQDDLPQELKIETMAGVSNVTFESENKIRVDMGRPIFDPKTIPIESEKNFWGRTISIDDRELSIFTLSMGNPHAVIFVDEKKELSDVSSIGPRVEKHSLFPKRTNVEFVYVGNRKEMDVRVWERSAGETAACGSGACASAVVAISQDLVNSPVTIHFSRGDVEVGWKRGESVFMTGPATYVYKGEVAL